MGEGGLWLRQPRGPAVQRKAALQKSPASLPLDRQHPSPSQPRPPPLAEKRTKLVRGLQTGLCVAGAG